MTSSCRRSTTSCPKPPSFYNFILSSLPKLKVMIILFYSSSRSELTKQVLNLTNNVDRENSSQISWEMDSVSHWLRFSPLGFLEYFHRQNTMYSLPIQHNINHHHIRQNKNTPLTVAIHTLKLNWNNYTKSLKISIRYSPLLYTLNSNIGRRPQS